MKAVAGLPTTLRLTWRRNRGFWLWWLFGTVMLMPITVSKYQELIPPGPQGTALLDLLAANPTMRAMLGPPFDLSTPGGFAMWRVGTFTAAALAMMTALGVIRATRAEEEEGRLEQLRAGAIGRHAPLAAGLVLALAACAVFAVVHTVALIRLGTPTAGALAASLGLALTGTMFAGVGAVAAQVFESARAARSWSLGAILGGLYLLRSLIDGAGDGNIMEPLRWVVPLEWAALARPYASERWWVLLLPVAVTGVLIVVAVRLEARRDHGAGIWHTGIGPAHAHGRADAWGLAWRLQRASVRGWSIGLIVAAAGMGSLAGAIDRFVDSDAAMADVLRRLGGGAVLRDAFYVAMLGILVTLIAVAAVVLLGRLRTEETAGRSEVMLATATSRDTLAASHLAWALGVGTLVTLAVGAALPLGQVGARGAGLIGTLTGAAAVLLPGVWLMIGLGFFLIGWAPRLYGVVWAVLGWTIFCTWLAALFTLPDWVVRVQPWGRLPHLPSDPMTWTAVLVETAVAALLFGFGLVGYRRRDIAGR